ncbi:hypothetical protein BDN71DRAFT_1065678 [Pleurotus eryngii]|uniref:Uncharacterized protein n=1 Tax=Pleurotus eryngii TaxID=5323 RepID=A0A9P5ZVX8_PLEER|nr:hypothetical protein BDN71DRAFT_1065678 [Pleurotus eryngii]
MAVLWRQRSGRGLGVGSPGGRAQSAQDAATTQTVTTGKKQGRPRGPHQKPASNPTTCVNAAAKRKAKAGGARGPSQVNKNRNKHSKQQALRVGAVQSHSNSPAAVKSKLKKNSARDAITNSNGARTSASSSISHPKAPTLTPATPRPQPLSPISPMKAKSRNSKRQRVPKQRELPLLPTIAARSKSRSRKNSKGETSLRTTPSLPHARAVVQSSRPSSSLHAQSTSSTLSPPSRPPGRPPIIHGGNHTADPLNDWRFRTNDFVPVQKFSEDEEAAFQQTKHKQAKAKAEGAGLRDDERNRIERER